MSIRAEDTIRPKFKPIKKQPISMDVVLSLTEQKLADIIIPHHNRHDALSDLLCCLDNRLFNIIVVSGSSFGENCNLGAKIAKTDNFIFMNDDIIISTEQLIRITNCIGQYDIVGSTQLAGMDPINKKKYWGIGLFENSDGSIRHQISMNEENSLLPSGFCFGVKRSAWKKLNGFNEQFRTGNEDVDFGLRAMGLKMKTIVLDLEIEHKESQSSGRFSFCGENEQLFYSIWRKKLKKIYNSVYKDKINTSNLFPQNSSINNVFKHKDK